MPPPGPQQIRQQEKHEEKLKDIKEQVAQGKLVIRQMTAEERRVENIDSLPQSLAESLDVMEQSELVAQTLGEHVFDYFIRNKRAEWDSYKKQVTQWELDRYLGSL